MENGVSHESNDFHGSVYGNGIYSDYVVPVQNQIAEAISLAIKYVKSVPAARNNVFTIADYGSADGGTSMPLIYACVEQLRKTHGSELPIHVVYEDQSDNDFKPLFQRLEGLDPGAKTYLKAFKNVYATACGRSFYEQCLPKGTVDFAFSAFAMHYLSKKPCDVTGGIHHTMITCPKEKQKFQEQSDRDWETILLKRAEELRSGGKMVMVNLVTNDQGEFLGYSKSSKNPFYPYMTGVWRQMLKEQLITEEEFHFMTIVNYYRTQDDWEKPFRSEKSPVRKAGLSMVHFETRVDRFSRYREPWLKKENGAEKYAAWYTTMVRTWTQSTFYSALSDSRSEEEKTKITDEFFRRWKADVVQTPEDHGVEPVVYALMVIEKN